MAMARQTKNSDQEFANKIEYDQIQKLYDDETIYLQQDKKWLKLCVLCFGTISPFEVGYHLQCCKTSYVHESCRLQRRGTRSWTVGALNRRAGRLNRRQVPFEGKRCPNCRGSDAVLVRFTDHLQYMEKVLVRCPVKDCSKQLSAVDLLKHYAECADKDSWFTAQQQNSTSTIRGARKRDSRGNVIDLTLDTGAASGSNAEESEETDNVFDIFRGIEEELYGNPLFIAEQNFEDPPVEEHEEEEETVQQNQQNEQNEEEAVHQNEQSLQQLQDMPDVNDRIALMVEHLRHGDDPIYDSEEDNEDERLAYHLQRSDLEVFL